MFPFYCPACGQTIQSTQGINIIYARDEWLYRTVHVFCEACHTDTFFVQRLDKEEKCQADASSP